MIDKKWVEKNQIFIYLLIIILGMTALKIKYGYRGEVESQKSKVKSKNEEIISIPTVEATPTADPKKDYPLKDKLPYYGKGYVIEKYTAPMTLKMILNGATETNAIKDVTVWLNSFGDAIGQHKVEMEEK
jgi:hypothetical protein